MDSLGSIKLSIFKEKEISKRNELCTEKIVRAG